ncbi:choline transporter [Aspergillus carlsbadensis]|nr:choline transporter [Aspergillus carlsbadensis]
MATTDRASIKPGDLEEHDDDAILRANGHEAVMPRQFNWISALGLGFSITNSWIGYLSCFGQNLRYGGSQTCIFSLLVAFFAQCVVAIGLGELASAYPSSGGQYHFCYILSPAHSKKYSAYVVGWISMLAWWTVTCSGISLAAVVLNGIVAFVYPDYAANQWQTYCLYVAVATVTILPVLFSSKMYATAQASLYLSLSGYLIFFIVALVMHKSRMPASFLTQSGLGNSGWNDGTAWLLSISNSMYAFGGIDGVIHISEEMPRPGKRIPQVIILTLAIGLCTALSLFIVLMLFQRDLDAVRSATLPSLELIYQVTGSRSVTLGLFILLFVIYTICLPCQWVTAGRLAWAFARDHGVPFAPFFSSIHPTLQFPLNATAAAYVFTCIYGLLYLASTTAFNSIITSAVLFLNISYTVPQGILLVRGRDILPRRYFDLTRFGLGVFANVFSTLWVVVLGVLICMPPNLPVSLTSMNYTPVILVGVFVIINVIWFFAGRRSFEGPRIDWEVINQAAR